MSAPVIGLPGAARRRRRWPLAALAALVLVALSAATQVFATVLHHHPSLGYRTHQIYLPWSILFWAPTWHTRFPNAVQAACSAGGLAFVVGTALLLTVASLASARVNRYTHGSAHWATEAEIRASGLLPRHPWFSRRANDLKKAAIYVGAWVDKWGNFRYLRHRGNEHVMTVAPTRSGKTLGPILMNLLSWPHSMFVLDLKGELHLLTSGWRKRCARNKILIYEPASPESPGWNLLDELDVRSPTAVGDAQNYAAVIADPHGKGHDNHWDMTAEALVAGMILYTLHKAQRGGPPASLPQIDAEWSNPDRSLTELWSDMVSMADVCSLVAAAGKDMLVRPPDEAASVLSSAKKFFTLYRDPVVAHNVSRSDFSVRDLMQHADPVTLYLVTRHEEKQRLQPLVRLLMTSIIRGSGVRLERIRKEARPPWWWPFKWSPFARRLSVRIKGIYRHRLLMLLDEFKSVGRLSVLQEAMSYLAGFGITVYIAVQDITQLRSVQTGYGPDEEFIGACHIKTAYPPNRPETAEYISSLLGVTTVVHEQVTLGPNGIGRRSVTVQEVERRLLTADECTRIPGPTKVAGEESDIVAPGNMIVHIAGYSAIFGTQPLVIFDDEFIRRMSIEPVKSDVLRTRVSI